MYQMVIRAQKEKQSEVRWLETRVDAIHVGWSEKVSLMTFEQNLKEE